MIPYEPPSTAAFSGCGPTSTSRRVVRFLGPFRQRTRHDGRVVACAVRWSEQGLEIVRPTLLRTEKPAARLATSVKQSGTLTIEAWVRPAKVPQTGPARIVTLSRDTNLRNFTLGHDGDKFEVRSDRRLYGRAARRRSEGRWSVHRPGDSPGACFPESAGRDGTHTGRRHVFPPQPLGPVRSQL